MKFISYLFFRFFIILFSLTPFAVLYLFSDLMSFLLRKVIKYRYKVIQENISCSFPDYTVKERNIIIRKFYSNLTDVMIETIKSYSMSEKKLAQHVKVLNPEIFDSYFISKKSVCGITSHYANWEWTALVAQHYLKHNNNAFYRPLSNKFIDRYLKINRSKSGMHLYPIQITARAFIENKNKTCFFIMVADQSPSKVEQAYWFDFLNQKTAFLHGPEMYAKKYNLPVYFIDIQRVKRGLYEVILSPIAENPSILSEGKITHLYMKKLEEVIKLKPEDWLWSHRRWKIKPVI
jgi:Kdo2-lipid IVA lauroyltransferase/acyltransferase